MQIRKLAPLLERLNVNVCFETALFSSLNSVKLANMYADELIVDVKILNSQKCREILGGDLNQYLTNLKYLDLSKTTFRIPVSKYSLAYRDEISDLLKKFPPRKLEIFKLHDLAKKKYGLLDKDFYHDNISDVQIMEFKDKLKEIIPNTKIISI